MTISTIETSPETWRTEIGQLEEESRVAFLAQDIERLRQLFSEDLAVNSPLNRINSCAQVLDLLQRGVIRHSSMEQHIELVARHGDTVVVMGHDAVRNAPDEPVVRRRFTNVWRAAEGSWLLIARQATLIPDA